MSGSPKCLKGLLHTLSSTCHGTGKAVLNLVSRMRTGAAGIFMGTAVLLQPYSTIHNSRMSACTAVSDTTAVLKY
jgi:hypothetical protein